MNDIIYIDISKTKVCDNKISRVSKYSFIQLTNELRIPTFTGSCSIGDNMYWTKVYNFLGRYLQSEQIKCVYINDFAGVNKRYDLLNDLYRYR